jgi:hypothetical protein
MKRKFWFCVSLFLVLITVLQPIFAEPQMDKTGIQIYSDNEDYTITDMGYYMIFEHDTITFKAWLSLIDGGYWISPLLDWRWLNFYLYKVNGDGSNGKLLFHDREKTGR